MPRPQPGQRIRIPAMRGDKRVRLTATIIAHRGERWSDIRIDIPNQPSKITTWRI